METSRHWCSSFPIGFRFDPKDEVLVSFYLRRKIQELDLPNGPIVEADVYAHEPWFLHQGNDPYMVNNDRYFFVKREPVSRNGNGKRIKRDMEGDSNGGWWKANTGDMEIKDSEGHLVGYMKSLTFFKYKNNERIRKEATKTDWIMHEYRLASDVQFQCWTLCRIRYRGHHLQHGTRTETSEQAILCTRTETLSEQSSSTEVLLIPDQAFLGTSKQAFAEVPISEQTFSGTMTNPSLEQVVLDAAHETESIHLPLDFQAFLEDLLI